MEPELTDTTFSDRPKHRSFQLLVVLLLCLSVIGNMALGWKLWHGSPPVTSIAQPTPTPTPVSLDAILEKKERDYFISDVLPTLDASVQNQFLGSTIQSVTPLREFFNPYAATQHGDLLYLVDSTKTSTDSAVIHSFSLVDQTRSLTITSPPCKKVDRYVQNKNIVLSISNCEESQSQTYFISLPSFQITKLAHPLGGPQEFILGKLRDNIIDNSETFTIEYVYGKGVGVYSLKTGKLLDYIDPKKYSRE